MNSDASSFGALDAAAAAVTLDGVSMTYPGASIPAVDGITLRIRPGEIFTLLGPSGCGKTTTLRLIAGLERPDAGEIAFGATVVSSTRAFIAPDRRDLGMVFQSGAVWPHMTVAQNVAFPLKVRRIPRAEVRRRVAAVLDLVGLPAHDDRMTTSLSGGQQQRVALARALVTEPSALLLDEPFSSLDTALRAQMRDDVRKLQQRLQIAMVFVTHDQHEALSLSDRIAVMRDGVLQQVGTPNDLYQRPATTFVRDFLGRSVLFTGTSCAVTAQGAAVALNGSAEAVLCTQCPVPHGAPCVVALRPEDVTVTRRLGASRPAAVALAGQITDVRCNGKRIDYRIDVDGQGVLEVRGDRHDVHGIGAYVWLELNAKGATFWPVE